MRTFPSSETFRDNYASGKPQIVWARLTNDLDTPVSAFAKLAADEPYGCLLESVEGGEQRGRYSIIAYAPDLLWKVEDGEVATADPRQDPSAFSLVSEDPVTALKSLIKSHRIDIPEDLPPMASGLFGYLAYDMIRHVEHLPHINPDPLGTPDALLMRPTVIAIFDALKQEFILASPVWETEDEDEDADAARTKADSRIADAVERLRKPKTHLSIPERSETTKVKPQQTIDPEDFRQRVVASKEYIKAGDVFQVVVGQRYTAKIESSPLSVYRALRRLNPSPFLYLVNLNGFSIVGSSPEILVRLRDQKVTLRPLAGSRPRGATQEEDLALEQDLLGDKKERAEHLMLLDLGRNDVGRVCKPGSVKVSEAFVVERYSHIMHIVSNVEGELANDQDAISAMFAGFPAGTVSGAPKVRAMEIIDELESEKRGIYAGAIGYFSAGGDMDTAIALRTAVIKDGVMHVRAGAGLVLDSDPETERMETLHKAMALFRAAEEASLYD